MRPAARMSDAAVGGGKTRFFRNCQGMNICTYTWDVDAALYSCPEAILVLVHGIQSHCRFEYLRKKFDPAPSTPQAAQRDWEALNSMFTGASGVQTEPKRVATNLSPSKHLPKFSEPVELNDRSKTLLDEYGYEGSWVKRFVDKGFRCCGIDLQGHGRSEGYGYCNVHHFDEYADDLILLIELLRNEARLEHVVKSVAAGRKHERGSRVPCLPPVYVLGISMGGCVCLRAVELSQQRKRVKASATESAAIMGECSNVSSDIAGCILLSPMLSVKRLRAQPLNRMLLNVSTALDAVVPRLRVAALAKNDRFPWIERRKQEDAETLKGNLSVHLAMQCMKATDTATEDAGTSYPSTTSCLIVHSKHDTMCEPSGSINLYRSILNDVWGIGTKPRFWFSNDTRRGAQPEENIAFPEDEVLGSTKMTVLTRDTPSASKTLLLMPFMWHYLTLEPNNVELQQFIIFWLKTELHRYSGNQSRPKRSHL